MLCAYPIQSSRLISGQKYSFEYPCGQCLPCRITKRQEWTGRIILESLVHERNWFITLTYNNENYPADGSLSKRHLQLFFKRLRKRLGSFRYFAVGEYGRKTRRAHYHAIIFGLSENLLTDQSLSDIWGKGFTTLSEFNPARGAYAANYTTKKLSSWSSEAHPTIDHTKEFSVMSRKPALGNWFVDAMEETIKKRNEHIVRLSGVEITLDSLQVFRINGKIYPIGRTLKDKLRTLFPESEIDRFTKMDLKHRLYSISPEYRQERLKKQRVSLKNGQRTKKKIHNSQGRSGL